MIKVVSPTVLQWWPYRLTVLTNAHHQTLTTGGQQWQKEDLTGGQFFFDTVWQCVDERCAHMMQADGGVISISYDDHVLVVALDDGDVPVEHVDAMFVKINDMEKAWRLVQQYRPRLVSPWGILLTQQDQALIFAQHVMQQQRSVPKFIIPWQELFV